jgi:hypothetical protein
VRKLKLLVTAVVALAMLAVPGAALAKKRDRDHDKMPDRWERAHHLSTHKKNAGRDPDRDGLKNIGEFRARTRPHDADSDNDGREDGDEDRDHDRVDNGNELREHTRLRDGDSDDDGVGDGREDRDHDGLRNRGEDRTGNDPVDDDTDDDGIDDGDENAGTIASFDAATNTLTIRLTNGDEVSGVVNDATEIECETEDENEDEHNHRGRGRGGDDDVSGARDGSDDNSGPGSGDAADDNSGPGSGDDSDDNSGPGSREEHDGDEDDVCTTADLTPGTVVHEAELNTTPDPDQWREVELVK